MRLTGIGGRHPSDSNADNYYDDYAELYEKYTRVVDHLYGQPMREWLAAHLPARGDRALDLGCGAGRLVPLLADRFDEVLAIDVADRMLQIARRTRARETVRYELRDLMEVTPQRDGQFDLVLSVSVLYLAGEPASVLPHVRSLVAPGGTALLVDVVDLAARYGSASWHRRFSVREAARVLATGGSPGDAATVLRLRNHPRWLQQVTSHSPLTPDRFNRVY